MEQEGTGHPGNNKAPGWVQTLPGALCFGSSGGSREGQEARVKTFGSRAGEHGNGQCQDSRPDPGRDAISVLMAVPWQLTLFLMWMMLVMRQWEAFGILLLVFAVLSTGLYFFWYRFLGKEVQEIERIR